MGVIRTKRCGRNAGICFAGAIIKMKKVFFLSLILAGLSFSPIAIALASTVNISITDLGFVPQSVTIKVGDIIRWTNNSSNTSAPSSDPHPPHTDYPALNSGGIGVEDFFETVPLVNIGTWGYHDHFNLDFTGTIVVGSSGGGAAGGCADCTPPGVLNLSATPLDYKSVEIIFTTDELSRVKIEFGTSTSYSYVLVSEFQ